MKLSPPSRTACPRYNRAASDIPLTTPLSPLGATAFVTLACLAALMTPSQAPAQKKVNGEWFVVPGQITSEVYHTIRNDTERAIKRGVTTIVYEFQSRELSEFGPCYDLANFLNTGLQGQVQTYAVIDSAINGHAVLPVMACRTVYMTKQGSLGFDQRAVEKAGLINATMANSYVNIGESKGRPPALLVKMLKPELTVYAFDNDKGRQIRLDKTQTDEFNLGIDAKFTVGAEDQRFARQVLLPAGAHGVYKDDFAERNNLINRSYPTKQEIVNVIGVPVGRTPLPDRPRAAVIEITGEADNGTYEMVQEKIRRAIAEDVHCIIFQLDNAAGGADSLSGASQVANYLHEQAREIKRIKTVAFIPENCTGSANLIAIACDEIVMGPQGKLGDVNSLVYKAPNQPFDDNDITVRIDNWKAIAKKSGFSELLIEGMFRRDLEIVQVQEKPDPNRPQQNLGTQLMDKREAAGPNWVILEGPPVKKKGELLVLDANRAVELGAARNALQSREIQGVYTMYGILDGDVTVMRASWLDNLVFFLKHPATTVLLVILGFTCMILEFKAPGTMVPAIIAAICFLLLFWAHSWLAGQVNALAVLLFLLGIVMLGVEVFVLPGFGVTGVSGIVLMLLALSLLVVRQWPQTTDEYLLLGRNFGIFAGGLIFSVVGAFAVARYLPHIPYANRLMLPAPDEDGDAAGTLPPASSPSLLGAVGTAVTELRPAGRACFGDEYIDVTSESGYVEPGRRVQIIEIDGLRVVVKPV
jgi:membrane-bound serine protease (ClpP class)